MNYCYLDFEYTGASQNKHPRLLCVSMKLSDKPALKTWWLDGEAEHFNEAIKWTMKHGYTFVSYNVIAEARCFLALGINPTKLNWIDLHLEDKQITNSFDKWGYGKQLIDGKVVQTSNIGKWDYEADEAYFKGVNRSKPQKNLGAFVYRTTGQLIDSKEKKDTLALILGQDDYNDAEKDQIMRYCESDIEYLEHGLEAVLQIQMRRLKRTEPQALAAMLKRGEYAAHSAIIESRGHPVAAEELIKFQEVSGDILRDVQKDIASQFPGEYCPFVEVTKVFRDENGKMEKDENGKNRRVGTGVWKADLSAISNWIKKESGYYDKWKLTDKGNIRVIAEESWREFFSYKNNYPSGNYAAQILRFNSVRRSLNGFMPGSKKSILGSFSRRDSRVRNYANIYGSQTGRSQPGSTDTLSLKARWARVLIQPNEPGRIICGIDYSSQEILIQAILSGDENLFKAYASGDVYLYFGKLAGVIPKDGTKKSHSLQRNLFKTIVLGKSFGMGLGRLRHSLSQVSGRDFGAEEVLKFDNYYNQAFSTYVSWRSKIINRYNAAGFLELPSGWALGPDNKSETSVKNFPVQGCGSDVMREAVKLCHEAGLEVIFTLHDALYIELDLPGAAETIEKFGQLMIQAFANVMQHKWAKEVRVDAQAWGLPDLEIAGVKCQPRYIDEDSSRDLLFFGKNFMSKDSYDSVKKYCEAQGWN